MGYAVFAARKIMLTSKISDTQFRIMCLSQRQQALADKAGQLQQALGNAKSINNLIAQQAQSSYMNGIYGSLQNGGALAGGGITSSVFQSVLAPQALQAANNNWALDQSSQGILYAVNQEEKQITMERQRLETQLKAMQAEKESVDKAEEQEIKNSAPKFA